MVKINEVCNFSADRQELPIRFAHRVKELHELPVDLAKTPSIVKVKNWYAQSFEELVDFPAPRLPEALQRKLSKLITVETERDSVPSVPNPSLQSDAQLEDGVSKTHLDSNGQAQGCAIKGRPILNYGLQTKLLDDIKWPQEVLDYDTRFTQCLERIKRRHDAVVTTVAQGVLEYKRAKHRSGIEVDVQQFLDRFYMSRIGIRMLIGQHIALGRENMNKRQDALGRIAANAVNRSLAGTVVSDASGRSPEEYVGIICTNTNVGAVAHEAIENARFVCEEYYGLFRAPPVQLVCPSNLTFMYVPSHLNHMLFELLKNSLRAVVERYGTENEDNFPTTKVIVIEGKEDITIKISDEGGGIPRSEVPMAWTYMYTTATSDDLDPDFQSSDFHAPMAGFGYGLPLARLYARYFGGDLKLISMEGYGTDVYLHLNRLSSTTEPLP
ncbi:hypothetical protein MVES_000820 [Malassezia vespertilionis]|uniref:Protein-serine/threonine kinase n=1 Tax=Malassezia vespertilionis TaxID=2020962 RepID=A0A2N1JE22_9BASI|nr:hypothetical protein MVES_000820 [Malassezia vespertilionis]